MRLINAYLLLYVAVSVLPKLDPPVKTEVAVRLIDGNKKTCMKLSTANMYVFSGRLRRFVPFPKGVCFLRGLVIKRCVPSSIKRSFSVAITGRLICSSSLVEVVMKEKKSSQKCGGGVYHVCRMRDATKSGDDLTTCVAECRCGGDDCSTLAINIEQYNDEWKWEICEISLNRLM